MHTKKLLILAVLVLSLMQVHAQENSNSDDLLRSAIEIRDTLDHALVNEYHVVRGWATSDEIISTTKRARELSKEQLHDAWSNPTTREFNEDGEAKADGDHSNDINPEATKLLTSLVSDSTNYPELFFTDYRGYTISGTGPTSDFDQGPDDWRLINTNGVLEFVKKKPQEGGEEWFYQANIDLSGFYVGPVEWDKSAGIWGSDLVTVIRDPETNQRLGVLKAVFDYSAFAQDFFTITPSNQVVLIIDQDGTLIASSDPEALVNDSHDYHWLGEAAQETIELNQSGGVIAAGNRLIGYAISNDANEYIVTVTQAEAAPVSIETSNSQESLLIPVLLGVVVLGLLFISFRERKE